MRHDTHIHTRTYTHTPEETLELVAVNQVVQMTLPDHPDLQMIPEWKKQYISYEVSFGFLFLDIFFTLSTFQRCSTIVSVT